MLFRFFLTLLFFIPFSLAQNVAEETFDEVDGFDIAEESLDDTERADNLTDLTRADDKAYGDAVDTLCGKYTTKRVEVKRNTIGTFTVQKQTKKCVALRVKRRVQGDEADLLHLLC